MERPPSDGWQEALELYKAQADDLHAGRTPRVANQDGLTIADLCNRFLAAKLRKTESGELSSRMFAEYRQTPDRRVAFFGKTRLVEYLRADDFESLRAEIAKRCGPVRLGNEITWFKSVFKHAAVNKLIEHPVTFGSEFEKPGKAVMRRHKADSDQKLFTCAEILTLAKEAGLQMKAAILLGVNCAAGNTDVANLEFRHLDLEGG